jgi:hypothetical protein
MAEQVGFLDALGVGTVDEGDIAEAQRFENFNKPFAQQAALGQQAAPLFGGLAGGIAGAFRPQGRTRQGLLSNVTQGATDTADARDAAAVGISVEQLRGRRKIRELAADVGADGSFESRQAMLKQILRVANEHGDAEVVGSTLQQLQALETEELAFNKLKSEKRAIDIRAEDDIRENAIFNGKPVTGTHVRTPDGAGLEFVDENGNVRREPWGQNLYMVDGSQMDPSKAVNLAFPSKERGEILATMKNALAMQQKMRRTMKMLVKATEAGDIGLMLGTPQKAVPIAQGVLSDVASYTSGFMRILSGTQRGEEQRTRARAQANFVQGGGSWQAFEGYTFQTPEWMQGSDDNARLFRANILDLAYMAARMREPSNRGLSDKDVETALNTLVAGARNPQTIMQRFAQMLGDGDHEINSTIAQITDRVPGVDNDFVLRRLTGRVYDQYIAEREAMRKDFGMDVDVNGIGIFDHLLGIEGSAVAQDDTDVLLPASTDTTYFEDLEFIDGTAVDTSAIEAQLEKR